MRDDVCCRDRGGITIAGGGPLLDGAIFRPDFSTTADDVVLFVESGAMHTGVLSLGSQAGIHFLLVTASGETIYHYQRAALTATDEDMPVRDGQAYVFRKLRLAPAGCAVTPGSDDIELNGRLAVLDISPANHNNITPLGRE